MTEFRRIGILGPGLLGGSLALALAKRHPEVAVTLWARSAERVAEVRQRGYEHITVDLDLAVQDADLVVLAVPVGAMRALAKRLVAARPAGGVVVTDVGSVKGLPHTELGGMLRGHGIKFIGSHPMAGSEQTGFDAASPELFDGAPCILTNDEGFSDADVNRLVAFWAGLGSRVGVMSALEHDRLVARISHMPHVLAVVCALVALEDEEDGHFCGGGLRDTSRVAAGDPNMWTEILLENRGEVVEPLRESARALERLAELIEHGQADALATALEEAQRRRQLLE